MAETTAQLDPATIMAAHPRSVRHFCFGVMLTNDEGCLPYQLAVAVGVRESIIVGVSEERDLLAAALAAAQEREQRLEALLQGSGEGHHVNGSYLSLAGRLAVRAALDGEGAARHWCNPACPDGCEEQTGYPGEGAAGRPRQSLRGLLPEGAAE